MIYKSKAYKAYKLGEIANLLKVSVQTIIREINRGHLRAWKVGKQWRVSEDDLKQYLDSRPDPLETD